MIRATHGVHSGSYYYEVEILQPESDDAHVRVGWSTRQGVLNSFVGYDKWSYGIRDIAGGKIEYVLSVIRSTADTLHYFVYRINYAWGQAI